MFYDMVSIYKTRIFSRKTFRTRIFFLKLGYYSHNFCQRIYLYDNSRRITFFKKMVNGDSCPAGVLLPTKPNYRLTTKFSGSTKST